MHQILPSYASYDAIGQETKILRSIFKSLGFHGEIYAQSGFGTDDVRSLDDYHEVNKKSLVVYHHSIGSNAFYQALKFKQKMICRFHNITPPWFFEKTTQTEQSCVLGYGQLNILEFFSLKFWPASFYSALQLHKSDYQVIPVLRDYHCLLSQKDEHVLAQSLTLRPTFLFVGRIVQNKGIHDLIFLKKILSQIQSLKNVRFLMIGSGQKQSYMQEKISPLIENLNLKYGDDLNDLSNDLVFLSGVSQKKLATCYRHTKALIYLSDHEGFGVPLVEAMHFKLPIIAHKSSAIPEVCQDGVMLVDKHNPVEVVQACLQSLQMKKVEYEKSLLNLSLKHATQLIEKEMNTIDRTITK
ncbi:MAG: glycosyltransferase [Oligoflexales bacterium]